MSISVGQPRGPGAALFDLDGTIVRSLELQESIWREVFESYLASRAQRYGEWHRPFDTPDYRAYVDGRPRHEGVATFLKTRGVTISEGEQSDPPEAETVHGLANRRDYLFLERIEQAEVRADPEAVRLIHELREVGARVALASASQHTRLVLERAGISGERLFDAQLDGQLAAQRRLRGKPCPDLWLTCLELLGSAEPARAVVFDDSTVGVEAARGAGIGLVVGIDRGGNATALREHGAEWVVGGFQEIGRDRITRYFDDKRSVEKRK